MKYHERMKRRLEEFQAQEGLTPEKFYKMADALLPDDVLQFRRVLVVACCHYSLHHPETRAEFNAYVKFLDALPALCAKQRLRVMHALRVSERLSYNAGWEVGVVAGGGTVKNRRAIPGSVPRKAAKP